LQKNQRTVHVVKINHVDMWSKAFVQYFHFAKTTVYFYNMHIVKLPFATFQHFYFAYCCDIIAIQLQLCMHLLCRILWTDCTRIRSESLAFQIRRTRT